MNFLLTFETAPFSCVYPVLNDAPPRGGMWQSHIFTIFDQFIFSTMIQRGSYFYLESGFKQTGTERHLLEANKPTCM